MANYYLQFSAQLNYQTDAQADWLRAQLDAAAESDEGSVASYEQEIAHKRFWLYAEEYGDPYRLKDIIAEWQTTFGITEPFVLTWAETCSKLRLDAFSGGAIAVYKGETKACSPERVVQAWIHERQTAECEAGGNGGGTY